MSQTSPLRGFGALIGKYTKSQKSEEEKPEEMDCADRTEREVPEEDITTDSLIRQNFHPEILKFLNKQVNLELQAWYTYLSMGIYFQRHDVALPGFAKFFMDSAKEEKGHARRFERYINKRGGSVVLQDIPKPSADSWGTGLRAIRIALDMEKSLNEVLLKLHQLAIKHKDPSVERFVKKFICEQVVMIKKLGDHETNLKRVGEKLGVYMFDKKTLNSEVVTKHGDKVDSVSDSDSHSDSDN
jgi:ferritin heavy chain